jgi:predicted Rossmann fold flavoprotein
MRRTVIIGGGAAGMIAAIVSAKEGDQVTILEHMDTLGKKLLSTGNGRCNLTNKRQERSCYHSENPDFPVPALKQFGCEETIRFFGRLGLFFKERDGYVYPRASQASTVREALLSALSDRKVAIRTGCQVHEILKEAPEANGGFLVCMEDTCVAADALVLACGGMAAPFTGSDGSGYDLAASLGHRLIPPVPALTGLFAAGSPLKKAAGVRTDGTITLYIEEKGRRRFVASDTGELQITDYGISGIPAFQVSRYASRAILEKKQVSAELNFLPEYEEKEVSAILLHALSLDRDCFRLLCGLFPEKLAAVLLKRAGIPLHALSGHLDEGRKRKLLDLSCRFPLEIVAVNDFAKAQVTAGGVDTREVSSKTMESKLVPGLYFAGELLDVDGCCGGYNLQWAWASGFLAGKQGRP